MKVRDIMTSTVDFLPASGTIRQAAEKMRSLDVGAIPISDGNRVIGLVTDRDIIIRAIAEGKDPFSTQISEIMTDELCFCDEDAEIEEAANIMQQNQIRRLLVNNQNGEMVGILSLGDLAVDSGDEYTSGETIRRVSEPSEPNL